jgi:hypothetical protein
MTMDGNKIPLKIKLMNKTESNNNKIISSSGPIKHLQIVKKETDSAKK